MDLTTENKEKNKETHKTKQMTMMMIGIRHLDGGFKKKGRRDDLEGEI